MSDEQGTPKIHVDSDWKAEAQAEKERLAKQEQERATPEGGRGPLPEANFSSLMKMLATQAIMGLGAFQDPQSGGVVVDLEGAKFSIDLLAVLEETTKGNISEQDAKDLEQMLTQLRAQFVQVTNMVAQAAAQGAVKSGDAMPGGGVMPGGPMPGGGAGVTPG